MGVQGIFPIGASLSTAVILSGAKDLSPADTVAYGENLRNGAVILSGAKDLSPAHACVGIVGESCLGDRYNGLSSPSLENEHKSEQNNGTHISISTNR